MHNTEHTVEALVRQHWRERHVKGHREQKKIRSTRKFNKGGQLAFILTPITNVLLFSAGQTANSSPHHAAIFQLKSFLLWGGGVVNLLEFPERGEEISSQHPVFFTGRHWKRKRSIHLTGFYGAL